MGRGGRSGEEIDRQIPWDEIKKHNTRTDRWIVIEDKVYNVSEWAKKHPGGSAIMGHYAGQDASEAFREFHKDKLKVSKYMAPICIGNVVPKASADLDEEEIKKDFLQLRKIAEDMDLFKPSKVFFSLIVGHLIFFEILAYMTLYYFGTGWIPTMFSVLFYTIVQAEAGWSQHDFGHLSVFKSVKWNKILHSFVMNFLKGASVSWWQHLHNQHHSKPNIINKDPDVRLEKVFVLGKEIPKRVAENKNNIMPYNWQHRYFFLIGPPLLFPVFFQMMVFKHPISRKNWLDVFIMCTFYLKVLILYTPFYGVLGTCLYYFVVRCLESHWFVWVSQSNHIPMDIEDDKERPWLALQLNATCDVEKSHFNDWFTGHLNFQIEHHCFPTMPRHNLYKIAPYVQSLCKKHGIEYKCKTLAGAFSDIVKSLKHSGEIWYAHYQSYHYK
ncbi:hypothetical protein HELRODRAFT_76893 [Helobdella robusta]|uniref:Cytochrome b5 heme-binding domain-containing protein n=1 Tax=Helobdella robusta TaxID=6412 RepID=T1G2Q6_HELRO|nr:hypothetical protein HELRODRAFT_76893 [Helobdella robusta]ESO06799.1 hypothetical protein HELRODRAFT_76893 [Helobdella robusta]